ncbi:MAG: hypothetical protein LBJ44_06760 [Propionibacteriaceae bacterium]|nr:hypothetical protein [Propionibacteriaceae bacterium]
MTLSHAASLNADHSVWFVVTFEVVDAPDTDADHVVRDSVTVAAGAAFCDTVI